VGPEPSGALSSEDLPALFRAADISSLHAQRGFIRSTRARLTLAVLAAVCATFAYAVEIDEVELLSVAAAFAFIAAFGVEVWLLDARPERRWYDGRALAESAKTLAWRYAVGGLPFPLEMERADIYLAEQLAQLLHDLPESDVLPTTDDAITPALSACRSQSFERRREQYVEGRIRDQQRWYASKADHNARRARAWRFGLIATELVGAVVALMKAFDVIHIDLTSVSSTAVGAGAAWLAVKQHEAVTRAYTVASHELALISARLAGISDEQPWAAEVADAEEAISREHTMWRAARAVHEHVSQKARP
jgi:hypothetical protein